MFVATPFFIPALAKEDVSDEDMAEMVASEIETLSNQLKKLEEELKVFSFYNFIFLKYIYKIFIVP